MHVDADNGLAAFGPTTETRASPCITWIGSYIFSLLFFFMMFFSLIEESPVLFVASTVVLFIYFGFATWAIYVLDYDYSIITFLSYAAIVYAITIYTMGAGYELSWKAWLIGLHILPLLNLGMAAVSSSLKVTSIVIRATLEVVGLVYKLDTKERYILTEGKEMYVPIIKGTPFRVSYELNSKKSKIKKIELLHTQYEKKGIGGFLMRYAYCVHVKLSHELQQDENLIIIAQ